MINIKKGIILLFFIGFGKLLGQGFNSSLNNKNLDCSDISNGRSFFFLKYFKENKLDSVRNIIKSWQSKCGLNEPVFRAKVLLSLKEKQPIEPFFKDSSMVYIINYQNRISDTIDVYDTYRADMQKYGYIPPFKEFDTFTKQEAEILKNQFIPESFEYLICDFYSNNSDTFFSKLQSGLYEEEKLTKDYNKMIDDLKKIPEWHIACISGIWIPTNDIKLFGTHPLFGFQIGFKKGKMNYDISMISRHKKTSSSYYAKRPGFKDSLELTNNFVGSYVGIDVGRDIFGKYGHEIQLIGGIGYEAFTALDENTEKKLKDAIVKSYNFNIGASYRYYITNSVYVGVRAKYNFVDYTLTKVIDFTSNPITLHFALGYVYQAEKDRMLKLLKYKLRK